MKKIKVLLADDSLDFASLMQQNLEFNPNIEVVGIANDGFEAVEMTKQLKPDVLVLDIVMPKLDGVGAVEKLHEENISVNIIMLSAMLSSTKQERLTSLLVSLGVDYLMAKPFDINSLVKRIIHLAGDDTTMDSAFEQKQSFVQQNTNVSSSNNVVQQNTNNNAMLASHDDNFESKITNIMQIVGIPAKLKGYQYIREAILLSIEQDDPSSKITKDIYPEIAKKFNSTSSRVERAIRHALEISWNTNGPSISNLLFGNSYMLGEKRPTNAEFIALITDRLKLEAKQCS